MAGTSVPASWVAAPYPIDRTTGPKLVGPAELPETEARDDDLGWPDAPQVPGPPEPDRLPLDGISPVLATQVVSVSANLQVPHELPLMLGLSAVATAVIGKCVVHVRSGWMEPTHIYTGTILPPASRKSPAFSQMIHPIKAWEAERVARMALEYRRAQDLLDVALHKLDRLKRAANQGKVTPLERDEARDEVDEAEKALPIDGRLLVGDATSEALVQRLAVQGGRAAILEPEPGPLQMAAGRYSDSASLGEINRAYSSEDIYVDRVGRAALRVPRPALVISVLVQPNVLEALPQGGALRAEGFLARFLWAQPPHGIGSRLTGDAVPPLDEVATRDYERMLRRLLDWEPKVAREAPDDRYVLILTDDALALLQAFEGEVERELAPGGKLHPILDWGGKLVGQAVRVSALLEMAARASSGAALEGPIGADSMAGAIRLARGLATHAVFVLYGLEQDAEAANLRHLLTQIQALGPDVTETDLRAAVRGRVSMKTAAQVARLVCRLEELDCVRRVHHTPTGQAGRSRSPILVLHPALRLPTRR